MLREQREAELQTHSPPCCCCRWGLSFSFLSLPLRLLLSLALSFSTLGWDAQISLKNKNDCVEFLSLEKMPRALD